MPSRTQFARYLCFAIPLVALTSFTTYQATRPAQDPKPAAMDPAKMMEVYLKMAQPVEQHKELQKMVGTWDTVTEAFMDPTKPGQKSKGIATIRSVLGGRYIVEETKGTMMGMQMQGFMILAYDRVAKEYVSVWMDNMGTGVHVSRGQKKGKVMTLEGLMKDTMTPKGRPFKVVATEVTDDKSTTEIYDSAPGIGEFKVMSITYTRRK